MLIFISTLVSVGFGYLFFRIVKPKSEVGSKLTSMREPFLLGAFLFQLLFISSLLQ